MAMCGQPLQSLLSFVRHRVQILLYQELSVFSMHSPVAAVNNERFAFLIFLTSGLGYVRAQNSKYIIMQCEATIAVFYVDVMQCVCPP